MNSSGAAPVPPSVPSTTTKSGQMPVSTIALQIARNSQGWPTQSLNPTGLPPQARRMSSIRRSISTGVENAECRDGEMQSSPIGTPWMAAISAVTFAAGKTPPWPGLAPWLSLISIILICGSAATALNFSGLNEPSGLRQPK
jgi:hypothetical protein